MGKRDVRGTMGSNAVNVTAYVLSGLVEGDMWENIAKLHQDEGWAVNNKPKLYAKRQSAPAVDAEQNAQNVDADQSVSTVDASAAVADAAMSSAGMRLAFLLASVSLQV